MTEDTIIDNRDLSTNGGKDIINTKTKVAEYIVIPKIKD